MACFLCAAFLLGLVHFLGLAILFRYTTGYYKVKKNLKGKVYIVTGATAGIGKATAYRLAQNGARVYMFCRNVEKANRVRREITRKAFSDDIQIIKCDFSDFESVKQAAKEFLATDDRIDGLINNAGLMYLRGSKQLTKDGQEVQMQANHLGHFLLTNLLLDKIKESKGRIVNVSSIAGLTHWNRGKTKNFDVNDLNYEKTKFYSDAAYCWSKLANILFTRELARRVYGTGVTVNCCHPGAVETDILAPNVPRFAVDKIVPIIVAFGFMKTSEQGAMTQLYLATSDDVENVSGEYFADCAPGKASVQALDDKLAADLWAASEKIVAQWA